jgi:hypothetical protein
MRKSNGDTRLFNTNNHVYVSPSPGALRARNVNVVGFSSRPKLQISKTAAAEAIAPEGIETA